jgi:hypothetical protein
MLGSRILAVVLAAGGLLVACSDDHPASPFPVTPGPTPVQLAPQTMVLKPSQLPGYVRTGDSTVDAGALADQEGDQSLLGTLMRQGLQIGARATFADPNRGGEPTPFATVISQVLFFKDAQGAASFFSDERKRRGKAPDGGTLSTLADLPTGGADDVVGMAVSLPAQASCDPPARALFALIRRGAIVAELLGGGNAQTATTDRFVALVTVQEQQLSARPA